MTKRGLSSVLSMATITVAAGALYLPFLGNPMVFDDLPFFFSDRFAYYATTPFGLDLRLPAYFTLAFPQVLWGQFPPWYQAEIHRVISLFIHVGCALALCKLIPMLCLLAQGNDMRTSYDDERARTLGLVGAVFFAVHPVAVYGAAYLVQRTILLATLFSLLSMIFFIRGIRRGRHADALLAAAFYTLAVFSKEHALLLPVVVVLVVPLVATLNRSFVFRHSGIYLLACLPAAATVLILVRWVIGKAYEPHVDDLLAQIDGISIVTIAGGPWFVSAVTQTGLFFKYLASWLVPNVSAMSIDMRVDFAATWSATWIALKVISFAGFGTLGLVFLRRSGRIGLVGFGMLYAWILFAVELSSVRFQEPFALYRSYLWAPGFLIAFIALISILPRKSVFALFVIAGSVLVFQAHDRLQTFSSNLALWEDAAAKLPARPVPGGARVLFGMAREQVYLGQLDRASRSAEQCMALYPQTWQCNFSRGAVHAQIGNYEQALASFDLALKFDSKSGPIHTHRGIALEKLDRVAEAREAYRRAAELGFLGGDYRLSMLDDPGTGGSRVLYDASKVNRKTE
jgi:hypothetical protein